MQPADASGTVTLRDKNTTEIHGASSDFYEFIVDRSTVSHRVNRFRGGCVSIDNDPRLGRPTTSQMKEV